jgi:pimeloyl-ACP methyl ester carboxylesterase
MEMFAADAAELLRALRIQSAHVVGISLGGGIAFQLVVSYPDLVKTLTVVNSAPEAILRTFTQKIQLLMRVIVVKTVGLPKMATILADKLFVDPDQDALRATFIARFSRNDKKSYLASLRAFIGWGVTSKIGAIACPTLILAADQDYTPLSMKESYVAKIPGATLVVIPESRHAVPMERPAQFNVALQNFLNSHKT